MRHLKADEYDEHERHICSYDDVGGLIYTQQYKRNEYIVFNSSLKIPRIEYCIYLTEENFKKDVRQVCFSRCSPFYDHKINRRKWIEENPEWVYNEELTKYFKNQNELDEELEAIGKEIDNDQEYPNEHDEDDYDEGYFNAMTDGQLGNYHDFKERGGTSDDIDIWAGR